jgi:sugar lactone lactonase YvrE
MAVADHSLEPFPGHDHGTWGPVAVRVVASWPPGHFAENLAVDDKGSVFVSLHSHHRVDRYDPVTRRLTEFARVPVPVAGLAFDRGGTLWATGGSVGESPGYVWRISGNGTWEEWLQVPDAVFMNGCAIDPGSRTLLVCESMTGRVLAVDLTERSWRPWISDAFLQPASEQIPGANGIKLHEGRAWISVTDRNVIMRASLRPDGSAGSLEFAAENLRGDDLAFAASGAIYVATHPAQTVLRLAPEGVRTTVAGPKEGAVGSTACAFGRAPDDRHALYVTTNGGLSLPYEGRLQDAKLLRLEVGEDGEPLPRG